MPNLGALITASLYVSAAYSCRTTVARVKPGSREARMWISIAILSIALGAGELLNLQAVMTNFGRTLAQQEGWYWQRQPVQATLIGISSTVTAVVVVLLLLARRTSFQCRVALTSAALIVCYTLVRASSLHDVDVMLSRSVFGLHLNRIPELAGIAVVLLASLSRLTSKRRSVRLGPPSGKTYRRCDYNFPGPSPVPHFYPQKPRDWSEPTATPAETEVI